MAQDMTFHPLTTYNAIMFAQMNDDRVDRAFGCMDDCGMSVHLYLKRRDHDEVTKIHLIPALGRHFSEEMSMEDALTSYKNLLEKGPFDGMTPPYIAMNREDISRYIRLDDDTVLGTPRVGQIVE